MFIYLSIILFYWSSTEVVRRVALAAEKQRCNKIRNKHAKIVVEVVVAAVLVEVEVIVAVVAAVVVVVVVAVAAAIVVLIVV
ncbi:hypothetical protein ElyMa_004836000 [Elysia marginata]|uniref:Uncharacterized protein n=1 Tax=Elysia marginata TaxID=1093978 RepID=A0AAV4IPC1_9GAST|nr:hypothetical protein ElyMa_004836000 [Elysia marginata]